VYSSLLKRCHASKTSERLKMRVNESRLNARIPVELKKEISRYIDVTPRMNESELVRQALREKLEKESLKP
jgi:metal-responsive CopG/Arc/MetJ family transcriptional regulator